VNGKNNQKTREGSQKKSTVKYIYNTALNRFCDQYGGLVGF